MEYELSRRGVPNNNDDAFFNLVFWVFIHGGCADASILNP